jgi:hypothetical protein
MDLWPFSPHFSGKLLCKKKVSNSWFQFQEERWLLMGNIGNLWTLPAHQFRWGTREDLSLGDLGGDLIGFSGFQHPTLSEKRTRSKSEGSWSIFLVQPWTWNMSRTDISYDFICNVHVNVYIYIYRKQSFHHVCHVRWPQGCCLPQAVATSSVPRSKRLASGSSRRHASSPPGKKPEMIRGQNVAIWVNPCKSSNFMADFSR